MKLKQKETNFFSIERPFILPLINQISKPFESKFPICKDAFCKSFFVRTRTVPFCLILTEATTELMP